MIVIVFGLPGSGKSFFASRFAEMIKADYINSDRVRKAMFVSRSYSEMETQAVYDKMLAEMTKAFRQNNSLVLDATFNNSSVRNKFIRALTGAGRIYFIEIQAEESISRNRVQVKRTDSEADFEVYQSIKNKWEPFLEDHLILESTNDNINEMLQKAAEYLKLQDDKRTNR